jgi:hypothetical protein
MMLAVMENKGKPSSDRASKGHRAKPIDKELVQQRWSTIMQMSDTGGNGLKNSIIEADKLLDHVMKQKGYAGATMAERLRHAESRFSKVNAVWAAHKLRNELAHEVGFDLVASHAKGALKDFERALRDLGAL